MNKDDLDRYLWTIGVLAAAFVLISFSAACARVSVRHGGEAGEQEASSGTYVPGLGDLMIGRVQPRHTKIWLAGKEKNWPLAAYELDELKEALADVARYQPHWNDLPIPDMVNSVMADRTKALNDAIDAGDEARFAAAYGKVTEGCNSCHRAADRGYLVIQVPGRSPFPDQDFRPVKK
ncbi:MAG: hypothetical protein WBD99_16655 [Thermodesulfobacteriota bacterium]